ncbi:MAG: uroporphyrinogen-III synthase, partial [Terriglobia bacterium]
QARRALAGVSVASIGPITSRTARALGLRVAVEANPYTVAGLVRAIENYVRQQRVQSTSSKLGRARFSDGR